MKRGAAPGAGQPPCQSFDNFVQIHFIIDDGGQRKPLVIEQLFKRRGLGDCSRKAIEQKASPTMEAAKTFADNTQHDVVWNELSAPHEVQGAGKNGGALFRGHGFCGAKHVAR